eukprot:TRINITY_DN9756_c0_g1_i2.p1 TRINITY_DN9756_c0_g1~~TRINITY_DN9756_c0_g1_i2.p1  ORF type:complete len:103 (+),score=7.92 TRINITY_DN9756_c0_g1_i2:151-459(+)
MPLVNIHLPVVLGVTYLYHVQKLDYSIFICLPYQKYDRSPLVHRNKHSPQDRVGHCHRLGSNRFSQEKTSKQQDSRFENDRAVHCGRHECLMLGCLRYHNIL